MDKLKYIKGNQGNSISIHYHITSVCNFKCSYCINEQSKIGNEVSSVEQMEKFYNFIVSLSQHYKGVRINVDLVGGEPLINKDIFFIIDRLFLIDFGTNEFHLTITTNGFFIGNHVKNLSRYSGIKNFKINNTYHFDEYRKLDRDNKRFLSNISWLISNNINFTTKFLLPTNTGDFLILKGLIDKLMYEYNLTRDNILLELLRFNGTRSCDYDQNIMQYFQSNGQFSKDLLLEGYEIEFISGEKRSASMDFIYCNGLNKFEGYQCYPYKLPTLLKIYPDLTGEFVGCKTLSNKSHSLDVLLDILKKNDDKYRICTDKVCDCYPAIGIEKKLSSTNYNYSLFLSQKLRGYFIFDDAIFTKVVYLKDRLCAKIEIYFMYGDAILVFCIEDKIGEEYLYSNDLLGIHYYIMDKKYGILEKNVIISNRITQKILDILLSFIPLFQTIIFKTGKDSAQ